MPDLLFHNGPIRTLDPARPLASALLVRGSRIIAFDDEARAQARHGYEDFDLNGRALLPGLTDAHIHLLWTGLMRSGADLSGASTREEALHRVARHVEKLPADSWVRGHGWDHETWGDWPTAAQLDAVTGGRPALLSRKDLHSTWVNHRALQLAGVDANTPDPADGAIGRDASGQPNGMLYEGASSLVTRVVPEFTRDEKRLALRHIIKVCNRYGLTSAHLKEGADSTSLLQELRESGELTLRALCSIPHNRLDEAIALGVRSGLGDEWVRLGAVKMFADGSLGSQTAWMLEPFWTEKGPGTNYGTPMMPDDVLFRDVRRAAQNGLALTIHAIGDRANRVVLDALTQPEVRAAHVGLPHRIEHAQHLAASDIPRFGAAGIVASVQPVHPVQDRDTAERLLGPQRSATTYGLRRLADGGATLAFGSDAPVESFDPWLGMYAAITRRADGDPRPGWHPELAVSLEEALRAYVVGPAHASGESHLKGMLGEGKLADLIVVEADPFTLAPPELRRLGVAQTFVGGRAVAMEE